jgi:hypothetical protein
MLETANASTPVAIIPGDKVRVWLTLILLVVQFRPSHPFSVAPPLSAFGCRFTTSQEQSTTISIPRKTISRPSRTNIFNLSFSLFIFPVNACPNICYFVDAASILLTLIGPTQYGLAGQP